MYRQRLTLTALTLIPLAMACGNETGDGTGSGSVGSGANADVTGAHWIVDSVTVDGTSHAAPAGANVEFGENGKVQGNYGCNHFSATATFKDGSIDVGETSMTEMACEEGPMEFERTLARTLADGALTTAVKGDELTLTTGTGDRVHLTKEQAAPLYGTKWAVTALGDGEVAQSLPEGADPYLVLDKEKGTVSGHLGCNDVSAKATVSDGHITLGTPKTTRMMCDSSLMDTEKTLLGLFDSKIGYELDHRSLTLTSTNGESVTAVAGK
ncbi:META domain-containing protein [Streptomyces sp. NBC_00554]|uniref:META domain-containing protein n=1 Tax=Streptomyces sp. NBC_00554 TaxID=2903661 RepID=UPI00352BD9DE|nr:META domain-containing protein [Streptomyces sp. NBC_00554]